MDLFESLEDDDYDFVCRAIKAGGPNCDLCGSSDHLLLKCPTLDKIKNDPRKLRRMVQALRIGDQTSPGSSHGRSSTPKRDNLSTHQIKDDDTDDDSIRSIEQHSLGADTDDESKD